MIILFLTRDIFDEILEINDKERNKWIDVIEINLMTNMRGVITMIEIDFVLIEEITMIGIFKINLF